MLYDLFICHASEDKEPFVRELAETLREQHIEVWYDEFTLSVGDSLRRAIDRGLSSSRLGAIVLSKAFFAKEWPQYELDGLLERELAARITVILPIWLDVDHSDVLKYSPSLAGRVAASSKRGVPDVAAKLIQAIRPQASPLVIARDFLLSYDISPPVVTHEYWLDVVEASNRMNSFGYHVPESATWHRWAFPLPETDGTSETRGERLAWTALQLEWTQKADKLGISVTTPPEAMLGFILNSPGLEDTCMAFPSLLAEYAPQLTIPGFGGVFEDLFEEHYQASVRECAIKSGTAWGTGTTTTGETPLCDGLWALRSPRLGDYDSWHVADEYFHGGEAGPPVALWDDADHLFWLFSSSSRWLPERIHSVLLDGHVRAYNRWPWHKCRECEWPHSGKLAEEIFSHELGAPSAAARLDILGRADVARIRLELPETSEWLADKFLAENVVQRCIQQQRAINMERERRTKSA